MSAIPRLCLLLLLLATLNCQGQPRRVAEPAFYYWKTAMSFTQDEALLAQDIGARQLYLRYFDVDWSAGYGSAVPLGVLSYDYSDEGLHLYDFQVIPTVYITNRTFERIGPEGLSTLADKVGRKISDLSGQLAEQASRSYPTDEASDEEGWERAELQRDSIRELWLGRISEIQIDCDWTATTRDRYFRFLELLQKAHPDIEISCTLRLHQYRDRKTMGVPPVPRVMLMCYNTGDVRRPDETDAILDTRVVEQYLQGPAYPMRLDLALPLFSWGAWRRGSAFQGLLRGMTIERAQASPFLSAEGANQFRVTRDTVLGGDYLREGDLIRIDGPQPGQMQKLTELLRDRLPGDRRRIAFFDWDHQKVKDHEEDIQGYLSAFR